MINFEGVINSPYYNKKLKKEEVPQNEITFTMPEEAKSIDIVTCHTNNYPLSFEDRYKTRLVVKIQKGNGKPLRKDHGNIGYHSHITHGHYKFSYNFKGEWKIRVELDSIGIPSHSKKKLSAFYGLSLKINFKDEERKDINSLFEKIKASTEQIEKPKKLPKRVTPAMGSSRV